MIQGKLSDAYNYEQQILNDIDYYNAPPGFFVQQSVEIIASRLSRRDAINAQDVLNKVKQREDVGSLADTLIGLQAEAHFQMEEYSQCLPLYCQLWKKALAMDQKPHIEQLKQQFVVLEERFGSSVFDELIQEYLGDDILKPLAYPSTAH